MKKRASTCLLAATLMTLPLTGALGHGSSAGSTDCHRESATYKYHCHTAGNGDTETLNIVGAAAGAARVGVMLWRLLDESPEPSTQSFSVQFRQTPNDGASGQDLYVGMSWRLKF